MREGCRPAALEAADAWTLQASAPWSREHLEASADWVGARLVAGFRVASGAQAPTLVAAHRWRYARVEAPWGAACLWDPAVRLGLCGDWCLGGRVEAAYDSGLSLARRVLADRRGSARF